MRMAGHMRNRIAFCAVLAALAADATEIQLLPAGEFRAIDGRPNDAPSWRIDAAIAARLQEKFAQRANPLPIDYEHQTMYAADNGQPAPAAGWVRSLEWREGKGLFAAVEWTPRARAMIAAGEYRFISPVIEYDKKTGAVLGLMPPALVNYAGIDGMQAVALSALAERWSGTETTQENSMNPLLAAVLAALGIKEDTKPEDATAAIAALKTQAGEAAALKTKVAELEPKAAKVAELETSIAALKSGTPDPAKFVPIETVKALQTEVASLSAQVHGRALDELVKGALADGKLLPAMEGWARELGKKDLAQLRAYLDAAQPIAALAGTQTGGKKPAGGGAGGLSDSQIAICKQMDLDPEAYKKQLATEAAAA